MLVESISLIEQSSVGTEECRSWCKGVDENGGCDWNAGVPACMSAKHEQTSPTCYPKTPADSTFSSDNHLLAISKAACLNCLHL
jgi:hypothetical protein